MLFVGIVIITNNETTTIKSVTQKLIICLHMSAYHITILTLYGNVNQLASF